MKKPKPSMRLGRRPSSACIAAQKLILKTKGLRPKTSPSVQASVPPVTAVCAKIPAKVGDTQNPDDVKNNPSSNFNPFKPSKHFGLKITHHGIVRPPIVKKGRSCTCEMCGESSKIVRCSLNTIVPLTPH